MKLTTVEFRLLLRTTFVYAPFGLSIFMSYFHAFICNANFELKLNDVGLIQMKFSSTSKEGKKRIPGVELKKSMSKKISFALFKRSIFSFQNK